MRTRKIRASVAPTSVSQGRLDEAIDAIKQPPNTVTPWMAQHGDFHDDAIVDLIGEFGPKDRIYPVVRNRGGTTVERWQSSGSLSEAQIEAISLFTWAWQLSIGEQRVTANWSLAPVVRGVPLEDWMNTQADAEEILRQMHREVFARAGGPYYSVWLNVVIFDEPAGVAGSRLGFTSKQAQAAAKTIVSLLSNQLASVFRLGTSKW